MEQAFLLRSMRRAYQALLYAYPPDFRRRYGAEMAQAFSDRCRGLAQTHGLAGLLRFGAHVCADWVATTIRERIASMQIPAPAGAAPVFDGVPGFYMCESWSPRPAALMNGAVLSIAVFSAVVFLLGHAGDRRILLIGSHHPSRNHLLPAQTAAAPSAELGAEIQVKAYPDEPPVSPYFKLILPLGAIDTDHDNILSASEIARAPAALRKLDINHDGKLTADECGARFLDDRLRLRFMRFHPALAALDADHDGEISAIEIEHAARALLTLDKNGDGQLTLDELLPPRR
jgi:hypothetical protein